MLIDQLPYPEIRLFSVIGAGGKSSLITRLAHEVDAHVIITTTTHIYAGQGPELTGDSLLDIQAYFDIHPKGTLYVGTPCGEKLCRPARDIKDLADISDLCLVEADGSKHLPLKAHRDFEPQEVPSSYCIYVIGAHGLNRPIEEVCHGASLIYQRFSDMSPHDNFDLALLLDNLAFEIAHDQIHPDSFAIHAPTGAYQECAQSIQAALAHAYPDAHSFVF